MGHKPPDIPLPANECGYAAAAGVTTPRAYYVKIYDTETGGRAEVEIPQDPTAPCHYYYLGQQGSIIINAEVWISNLGTTASVSWRFPNQENPPDLSGESEAIAATVEATGIVGNAEWLPITGANASTLIIGNSFIPTDDWLYEEESTPDGKIMRGVRRKKDKTNVLIKSDD